MSATVATTTTTPAPTQPDGGIPVVAFDAIESMIKVFDEKAAQLIKAKDSLEESFNRVSLELEQKNIELERKNIELRNSLARQEALGREVQQAKTMAALGEMSATVAHEIKNPIGAMGVWAGLLERDMDPQDPKRKTLGKITDGLAKLNKIVTNLLVYTRPVTAEFRIVRLDALLEEIVDFTEVEIGRLGRKIDVEKKFDCPDGGLCVKADPEKINQAVINLCLNAVQAMEDGGRLSVTLSTASGGGFARFSIIDTGSGISAENIKKIFDPFFTTKEDGTGLGLAIVKKIIESHMGTIEVTSERGVGTCVKCCLPVARD